jgi:hypothetical protein
MAKDISEIFSQTVDKFRTAKEQTQTGHDHRLSVLERDFESIKEQVRKLKPQIETHPKVNYFWLFKDKIVIDFLTAPNFPTAQVVIRVFHPGNDRMKKGIFGYLPDGYEMPLASVDDAVEFIAVQCGKRLA